VPRRLKKRGEHERPAAAHPPAAAPSPRQDYDSALRLAVGAAQRDTVYLAMARGSFAAGNYKAGAAAGGLGCCEEWRQGVLWAAESGRGASGCVGEGCFW
jgi:hypothetical protein